MLSGAHRLDGARAGVAPRTNAIVALRIVKRTRHG
jgi:hypothetical protein